MESWTNLLKARITELLSLPMDVGTKQVIVVGDRAQRDLLISDKLLPGESEGGRSAMDVWRACFTPAIVDVRPGHNYEVLETNGDSVIQSVTFSLLTEKFPGSITDEKLTLFKSVHLSKHVMAYISRQFKLPELLHPKTPSDMRNSESMAEDILEALFGTVNILVNRIFGTGKGALVATKLVLRMYGPERFDIGALRKNPTTAFKEINEELGWLKRGVAITKSVINVVMSRVEDRHVATMYIVGTEILDGLRSRGRVISASDVFATGIGDSEAEASDNMYENAVNEYRTVGIDERFIQESKRQRELARWKNENLVVESTVNQFLKKLGAQGFVDWKFYIPSKDLYQAGSVRRFVRLIGITPDGTEVPLNMAGGSSDKRAIANAVSNYALGR